MYLKEDRKKLIIESSMKDLTLWIWATTCEERSKVFGHLVDNLTNWTKKDLTISISPWWLLSSWGPIELAVIEKIIKSTKDTIKEVFGWSGWSVASVLWALWKSDQESLDHICNIPVSIMQDWRMVASNSSYITAAKMIPYLIGVSFKKDWKEIPYDKNKLQNCLISEFNNIFEQIMFYKTKWYLNWWLLPEHIIKSILTKILDLELPQTQSKLPDIRTRREYLWLPWLHWVDIKTTKLTYSDIYHTKEKTIGTLIAAKEKWWSYKTIKLNKENDVSVLDWVMASSHLWWKPLTLQIWDKEVLVKDPYFTTKTTAEQAIHDMVHPDSYHLALITLNNFRLNPEDLLLRLWIKKLIQQKFYADGVLAPNFLNINSLNPLNIPKIDDVIKEFMWNK